MAYDKGNYEDALVIWQDAKQLSDAASCKDLDKRIAQARKAIEHKKELIQEQKAWKRASDLGTLSAYQQYLKQYPADPHTPDAKKYVDELSDTDNDGVINRDDQCPDAAGLPPSGCPEVVEPGLPYTPQREARFRVEINNKPLNPEDTLWVPLNSVLKFTAFVLDAGGYSTAWGTVADNPEQTTLTSESQSVLTSAMLQTPGLYRFSVFAYGENIVRTEYMYQVYVYQNPTLEILGGNSKGQYWQYADFYNLSVHSKIDSRYTSAGSDFESSWSESYSNLLVVKNAYSNGSFSVDKGFFIDYNKYFFANKIEALEATYQFGTKLLPRGNHSMMVRYRDKNNIVSNPLAIKVKSARQFPVFFNTGIGALHYQASYEQLTIRYYSPDSSALIVSQAEKDSILNVSYEAVFQGDTLISITNPEPDSSTWKTRFTQFSLGIDLPYSSVEVSYFIASRPRPDFGDLSIESRYDTVFYHQNWQKKVLWKPQYAIKMIVYLTRFPREKKQDSFDLALNAQLLHTVSLTPVFEAQTGAGATAYRIRYPGHNFWMFGADLSYQFKLGAALIQPFVAGSTANFTFDTYVIHGGVNLRILF